jgi:multidrug efflux pump subunit AcrA (membrane-fusion protein)
MAKFKNKYILLIAGALILTATGIFMANKVIVKEDIHTVHSGSFELALNTKGEIQGKNAVVINMPSVLRKRELRLYQLQIKDLIAEGTVVKKGDWVATLDAATITQRIESNNQELEKARAELKDAQIDSTIQLTKLREELEEFNYDLEYKKLELEQSKYESTAYQRKKQTEYNKTLRMMEQKRRDLELTRLNLKMKIQRIEKRFNEYSESDRLLKEGMMACRVTAPKDGIVLYAKRWNGTKLQVGDNVDIWRPAIATLPDMSVLVSETYVQEIDITKIATGDSVLITIDALPDKQFTGVISKIANIGQDLAGYDTKVFRVLIDLNKKDDAIKPAMTTDNKIILQKLDDTIKIPREYLLGDSETHYVLIRKDGKIWKKEVVPGFDNDTEVTIVSGLKEKDKIFTTLPSDLDSIPFYKG